MALLTGTRLPGITFLPAPTTVGDELPPLDVAAFVGFAERGPLHLPVAVEDLATYRAIFGGDLALAREAGGRIAYAHLPEAVRSFFANGGRRCIVVRVAGEAATRSRFRLPGVVALDADDGEARGLATVAAAWEGAWSGRLQLASELRITPLPATAFSVTGGLTVRWESNSAPDAVQPGDVLEVVLGDETWLFPVGTVAEASAGSSTRILSAARAWRRVAQLDDSPPPPVTEVALLSVEGSVPLGVTATLEGALDSVEGGLVLRLAGADAAAINRGDVLRVVVDGAAYLFPAETVYSSRVESEGVGTSPPEATVEFHAQAMLALGAMALPTGEPLRRVNRLRFDLHLREGARRHPVVSELGFNDGQPRFWGDAVYTGSSALTRRSGTAMNGAALAEAAAAYRALQAMAPVADGADTRPLSALLAPIASEGDGTSLPTFLPLGMPAIVDERDFAGVDEEDAGSPPTTALGSDDLATYDPALFVDRNLVLAPGASRSLLLEAAFDRVYRQAIRLRGLHSLAFVDEVALIALPDAVHRGWESAPDLSLEGYKPWTMEPFVGADFLLCQGPPTVTQVTPAQGTTAGGAVVTVTGTGFTDSAQTEVRFGGVLAMDVAVVDEQTLTATAPPQLLAGPVTVTVTNWNGSGSLVDGFHYTLAPLAALPLLVEPGDYDEAPLRQVQRAALDFCQARADMVAILALPGHYGTRDSIAWLENLREEMGLSRRPVYSDERRQIIDLSYGAVYHPWLLLSDSTAKEGVRLVPPEGAVCGQIALRERQRGVWVASANQPLQGVLALEPVFSQEEWAELFGLGFNLLRRDSGAFRPLSAHTLSEERNLLQLSVRRLMILLRKVAHRRGMDYVFEDNDESFRAGVKFALEEMLERLYERGAFAGASPAQAFRVSTDTPPVAVDQGQFIAQIQVAPAQPLEFITVLLLAVGQGTLQTVER
jgi:hypothetical protein